MSQGLLYTVCRIHMGSIAHNRTTQGIQQLQKVESCSRIIPQIRTTVFVEEGIGLQMYHLRMYDTSTVSTIVLSIKYSVKGRNTRKIAIR